MKKIAVFASGNGTNAENIFNYFSKSSIGRVVNLYCNNKNANVINRFSPKKIPVFLFSKKELNNSKKIDVLLSENKIDYIVLCGFLLKIPERIICNYKDKIINIHPSLLPKHGGKGMYGENVHKSVLKNNDSISGITIHYVNKNYDEGGVVFQKSCNLSKNESLNSLTQKIKFLEKKHYPRIIEKIIVL